MHFDPLQLYILETYHTQFFSDYRFLNMMAALKRISDLESSVLYLESKNSELQSQFDKSMKISEQLIERIDRAGIIHIKQLFIS